LIGLAYKLLTLLERALVDTVECQLCSQKVAKS